jgi:hypothetical protein
MDFMRADWWVTLLHFKQREYCSDELEMFMWRDPENFRVAKNPQVVSPAFYLV